MPKSKRDKKISLTKTSKKGLALKQQIKDDIQKCVEKYQSIYVFYVENMRNDKMRQLRMDWKPSRFFFGKNKIMALALGKSAEDEVEQDLHKLSARVKGQCGLLFTGKPKDEVVEFFSNYREPGFARSGFKAVYPVTIPKGPLEQFSFAMEPYLRGQLQLPTALQKGVVTLLEDYDVCKKGTILNPEQAKVLELLGHQMAEFKLVLKCVWTRGEGFEELVTDEDNEKENGDEETNEVEMESEKSDDD